MNTKTNRKPEIKWIAYNPMTRKYEEIDIEVEELVERLDAGAIALLRQSAIEDNRVRQCVGVHTDALEFE